MSSLSEISIPHAPLPDLGDASEGPLGAATIRPWPPAELPQPRRPSPTTLVVLASCAGVGAIVLGALAGVSTLSRSDSSSQAFTAPAVTSSPPSAEKQALALLSKPSTQRIVFRGSGGRLLLAVGSGGRAAVLIRGLEPAASGRPYFAWIVGSGRPVRVARFDGTERAVFLDVPLGLHESVVVATTRPTSIEPGSQIVAVRG